MSAHRAVKGNNRVLPTIGLLSVLVVVWLQAAHAEILTPPYFNLAEGRLIVATATCGDEEPELYCKLVGANAENDDNINVIQGQVCDYCDLNNPMKNHPPEYAVDGMESWWQSPPLSRGMKYNEVNLTIDLGQEFHVAYVFVRMGNSPRPGLWALEKSSDYGKTYKPWQYFSDSPGDCETYFGKESLLPITRDDSVICNMEYSKIVPLENGEIPISLLNNRPSANKYFNSPVLQEWTRATNVRLRFLRTKTLLGHLMSVARQDPTVTRRYFYSIKDISIGGRCMCNGHADTCDIPDPDGSNKLQCRCQHHTCGPQCAYCCPGFQQKAWRQSQLWQRFVCEPCNCFNHSTECDYDPEIDTQGLSLDIHGKYEGGGVCKNCQHNTEGINCNKCKSTFYRPYGKNWNETNVCQPCNCNYHYSTGNCAEGTGQCECRKEFKRPLCKDCSYGYFGYPQCRPCTCNLNGTQGDFCEPHDGRCPCKDNYAGIYCDQCADGYYDPPNCQECGCNSIGSLTSACDQQSGNCTCRNNFSGRTCDKCAPGFFNYPNCTYCKCDTSGTLGAICNDKTGECLCKEGFGGPRCDQCIPGYYSKLIDRERVCVKCNCSLGSTTNSCDSNGKCTCMYNFVGKQCNLCSPGYYKYPDCLPCQCDSVGAIGITCDLEGHCQCKDNFDNIQCNVCKEGFYNFPACEECNCDPAGVIQSFAGCGSVPAGELCQCKERVQGRICDKCQPLYWNLQQSNSLGCQDCECHIPGTQGRIGVCDTKSGQCNCKYAVGGRGCSDCRNGFYNLTDTNLFGCVDCGCDIGGSVDNFCTKDTGQCKCRPRINGRRCNEPLQTHFFPTLHQYQYEVEDAYTPSGSLVRYGFSEEQFPGFSWKGYAAFSTIQSEILQEVQIYKPTVYRMVMRYINPNPTPIIGAIRITPDNDFDTKQFFEVLLKPTTTPQFVTVSGPQGTITSPFVMNPGIWQVSIQTTKDLYLDYFTLIPAAYYEATILSQNIESICTIGYKGLCRHFGYPNISSFNSVNSNGGFIPRNGVRSSIYQYIDDKQQLKELNEPEIPVINRDQEELLLELMVTKAGSHVMLIEYITPANETFLNGNTITVTARGSTSQENSKVFLNSCPYTFVCRQVVTDDKNKIHSFNIQDNFVSVTLKGEPESTVGIKSIIVIPYDQWHMDYVKLQPVCVRKNGVCTQAEFPIAPNSKKVEFESELLAPAKNRPQNIYDNLTQLVYLNSEKPPIDINSKVPFPGQYVFIVQYYQPDHPESEMEILIQNGQIYEATLPIKPCPSNSGCRSVIKTADKNINFSLTENFLITLQTKGQGVWLDYLMVVPAADYVESLLNQNKLDQTREFISTCGNNHFFVNISQEGFCRDAVFSLTSDSNNGASPCNCDYLGSQSFQCNPFGGQCDCKPNVIGRKCEICKTGYYGFPDCKPCNCPSLCEKDTGECICPTRVIGEKCDQCMPRTYGFHPLIGCEECQCKADGVVANDLQCNLLNGSCNCKPNVVGRTCDLCEVGHYSHPYCERCDCATIGTKRDICDQVTAECLCKSKVYGTRCDLCEEGTFDLKEENEAGCTKCFCFGKTTRCSSSNLFWGKISSMKEWYLVNIELDRNISVHPHQNPPQTINETVIGVDLTNNASINKVVYFGAPNDYLGNRLTSYGAKLEYSLFYTTGIFGNAVGQGDIILEGDDGVWLIHTDIEQPPSSTHWAKQMELRESKFTTLAGHPATRELLMTVLEDLKGIYIRATYWETSVTTRLQSVTLQVGIENLEYFNETERATSVEHCQCPINYKGSSCEECAEGFYRVDSGPHGGYCVPCQCNNHANSCDVRTGVCHDCQHKTMGDHCEQCIEGYHGNAVFGTPNDCLICACPLPIPSNNFATGCEVSSDGEHITCDCKRGYFGARCESCSSGFYGRPQTQGDFCKPCECSGNINPEDPGSCDTVTGNCLKCMNNTYGTACNLCEPGFFGDAVLLKDCQACICAELGMHRCNSYTGICECKEGVIGDKCDRCEDEHWGFELGKGCKACNCSAASHSRQCDDMTGQCKCKPGVTGKNCERCAPGFWNFTDEGCVTCGCNTEFSVGFGCNAATGHCECLPGVIGDKCDDCPHRWVLIYEQGCFECDACVHGLLNSTDDLHNLIDPLMTDFKNKASGYFTAQRLVYIANQMEKLIPSVRSLDPNKFDLTPISNKIDSLETDAKNLDRKADYGATDAVKLKRNAGDLMEKTQEVLNEIKLSSLKSGATVDHVYQLSYNLETSEWPKIDSALAEAKQILSDIKDKNLSPQINNSLILLENVGKLQQRLVKFLEPVNNQTETFKKHRDNLKMFDDNINDIQEFTKTSEKKSVKAEELNNKNRMSQITHKLDIVNAHNQESADDLKLASEYLVNATYGLHDVQENIKNATKETNEGLQINNLVNTTIKERNSQFKELEALKDQADYHQTILLDKSDQLTELLEMTKNNSKTENAVRGASAYPDIVKEINAAREAMVDADNATKSAHKLIKGLAERVSISKTNSTELHQEGKNSLHKVQAELQPLSDEAVKAVQNVQKIHNATDDADNGIISSLNAVHVTSLKIFMDDVAKNSKEVNQKTQDVNRTISDVMPLLMTSSIQAQNLPKDVADTEKSMASIKNHLTSIQKMVPKTSTLTEILQVKNETLSSALEKAREKRHNLRKVIAIAKSIASRIKVGVDFKSSTTLQLKPPDNVDELGTSTRVSAYFRTSVDDGLLMYLGNPEGTNLRRTKRDDFMALEVVKGYPRVTIDIGEGPFELLSNKYVADDKWYQIIVNRVGKNVELTIVEELKGGDKNSYTKEGKLPGTNIIFNLDKDQSKLFVGGYPGTYKIQDSVKFSTFQGQIEEVVIGDTPVGLWNFVEAQDTAGAHGRDALLDLQPSRGYRFDGEGYAIIDSKSHRIQEQVAIEFKFKTLAKDGLLFLVGKGKSFLSIEMREGKVFLQFRLGNNVLTIGTDKTYNDGFWHTLMASRRHKTGLLFIDDEKIDQNDADGEDVLLQVTDQMYFGGYPNRHNYIEVINQGFDGCIDDVTISSIPVNLNSNIQAFGVTPGCPEKVARVASFMEGTQGFIDGKNVSSSNAFQLNLKFKTTTKDGIIFYATNSDQSAGISLSLLNGTLVAISQKEKLTTGSNAYNDGQWHVVTVIHDANALRIVVDDYDDYSSDSAPPKLHFMYGSLYIGGVSPGYIITPQGGTASRKSFVGCLTEVTVNGAVINFTLSTTSNVELLARCETELKAASVGVLGFNVPLIPDEDGLDKEPVPKVTTTEAPRKNISRYSLSTSRPIIEERGTIPPETTTQRKVEESSRSTTASPRRPSPTQQPACSEYDQRKGNGDLVNGFRFGAQIDSRVEFEKLPGRYKDEFEFAVEFNTSSPDGGIIFYASDATDKYFVAVYMEEGKLHFSFDCGSGAAKLVSEKSFDDNEWHLLEFSRDAQAGKLIIDNELLDEGQSEGSWNAIVLQPPFYFGGLAVPSKNSTRKNLDENYASFNGCLRNFQMSQRPISDIKAKVGTYPCGENMNRGIYFGGHGGYVRVMKSFKVGTQLELSMEINSRTSSGLILSVYGKHDYFVVEIVNNTIIAKVKGVRGQFSASYSLAEPNLLCGNWHSIQILKSRHVITLGVNGKFSNPGVGTEPTTNTRSALIFGGHHRSLNALKGSSSKQGFMGCMRNIVIVGQTTWSQGQLQPTDAFGDAHVGLCPVD